MRLGEEGQGEGRWSNQKTASWKTSNNGVEEQKYVRKNCYGMIITLFLTSITKLKDCDVCTLYMNHRY